MPNPQSWPRSFQNAPARPQPWSNQPGQDAQNSPTRSSRLDILNVVQPPPTRQPPSDPFLQPSHPRAATEKPLIIAPIDSDPSPSSTPTTIETPVVVEPVKPYYGALCSGSSIKNLRTGKIPKPAPQACPPASPQFIQPSKQQTNTESASTVEIGFSKPNPRRDNKPQPYRLGAPPGSLTFPGSRCADFFHGKETTRKIMSVMLRLGMGSMTNLLTPLWNEQVSLRSSRVLSLKGKSALPSLASTFLTVLDKSQNYNSLTTPPTFKPPPHVTLPDMRREAWLRDLASLLVPLRRLLGTIPHGLKGPILLDQPAAGSIRTAHAVWFARCVGANELRGLKCKGVGAFTVGSESKWLKEWMTQVMRFLERTVAECGSSSDWWKQKVVHASNSVSGMASLVPGNVFLRYVANSLSDVKHNWDELLKSRRLGRRLAEALLGRAEAVGSL
ncbi:hypothetical protein HOY80DRAFT_1066536 [Tuber brumale]|nr:hypothetical protein HOY80DRAFT_1066536 [Tuber brumale]